MRESSAQSGIQVIARAAAILRACKDDRLGLSLGEIAVRVRLPRSTVQRIVAALAAEGLLDASGDARSIRLGPGIHAMADAGRYDVIERAHPHLKRLAEETGETVDLALLRGDHMVFVDQIAGLQRLRAVSAVGEQFPLYSTANGKAALALLEDAEIRKLCGGSHVDRLLREIQAIRKTGIAVDREEHSQGICAVGAGFKDLTGAVYAVSIPMPSVRFVNGEAPARAALLAAMAPLSAELGLRAP